MNPEIGSEKGDESWKEFGHRSLAHHAKSFHWASFFLPRETLGDVGLLYAFCRWVDDTADCQDPALATVGLERIKAQLLGKERPSSFLASVLEMFERRGIRLEYALELIAGAQGDLAQVRVKDDRELLIYCYRVAGTVGLMMRPLIGTTAQESDVFAVDLGIAMQLTNICRDVMEDAKNGRIYLPQERLQAVGVSPEALLSLDFSPQNVGIVIRDLLDVADRYYSSGEKGLRFIPWRTRLAILVASRVYRAIGVRLRFWNYNPLRGRAMVPPWRKVILTLQALVLFLAPRTWSQKRVCFHDNQLHLPLRGLPGI